MAATEAVLRPREPGRLRRDSTGLSFMLLVVGAVSVGAVIVGTLALIVARGATPVSSLVDTFTSTELQALLVAGIAGGALSMILGASVYRRMPTKVAREQAINGALLGSQAVLFGSGLLVFVTIGDVQRFTEKFLDFEAVRPHVSAFLRGARNTLVLAVTSMGIGLALGLLLAILTISKRAVVRAPARVFINFFRGTPLIWQLSFIYFGLSIGLGVNFSTYTGAILVLGMNTGAYAAEVFRAGIQSIEKGQIEAARGLGMSYLRALRHAVIPQAFRRVVPPLTNEFVILIKDTSLVIVLGLVAEERELFLVGRDLFSNTFNATFFLATAAGYLAVCLPLIRLVTMLERRIRSGLVGVTGHIMGER